MWIVEGKTFELYYKAYDYAMHLSFSENRVIEIAKEGSTKSVKIGQVRDINNW